MKKLRLIQLIYWLWMVTQGDILTIAHNINHSNVPQLLPNETHVIWSNDSKKAIYQQHSDVFGLEKGIKSMVDFDEIMMSDGAGSDAQENPDLIVKTKSGRVRGQRVKTPTGKLVDTWYGIPFAQNPSGELRFKAPKPIEPWDKNDTTFIYNATKFPNACIQVIDTFFDDFPGATMWNPNTPLSEDCLYLNIVVPVPRPKKAAVMVWIYGGSFNSGSSVLNIYDHRILSSEENIILVSMQYRVASLGFLYLGSVEAPGNMGLLDQAQSLQWIRDNIDAFGGSSDRITLFAESAGAASVSLHLLSPVSRNLFDRVIMQSGVATATWAASDKKDIMKRTLKLAKKLNCPYSQSNVPSVIDCLRRVDARKLVAAEEDDQLGVLEFAFAPVVDGIFLTENPETSLKNYNFKNTSILLGTNTEEGYYFLFYSMPELFRKQEEVLISRNQFEHAVNVLYPKVRKSVRDAIVFQYTDWMDYSNSARNRDMLDKMIGDKFFTCPVTEFAHTYSQSGNDVYLYLFSHRSANNPWPSWTGVLHGDEINYVFGEPLNPSRGYTQAEKELSKTMMRYWANFAKTGDPNTNEDGSFNSPVWPPLTEFGREYITLNINKTTVGRGFRVKFCAFWRTLVPSLQGNRDCGISNGSKIQKGYYESILSTIGFGVIMNGVAFFLFM